MFLLLPTEVVLEIFYYLDTVDIISLRQTCTHLALITEDKLIWANVIQQQRARLPLPSNARQNLEDWTSDALEALVISNELVDALWLVRRQTAPVKLNEKRGELLIGLQVFLDRWILAIYSDGFINLWDMETPGEEGLERWSCVQICSDKATSYQAALDDSGEKLLILVMTVPLPGQWLAALYEVLLSDFPLNFVLRCTFPASASQTVRHICPRESLAAFSKMNSVELVRWPGDSNEGVTLVADTTHSVELDDMFTTILSLRILDGYILIFKTRSIELHPIPDSKGSPSTVLRHNFPSYNFRDVRISDVETDSKQSLSEGEKVFTLRMLASDIIQGLFYFVVNVSFTTGQPPLLDVNLTAIHGMANHIPVHGRLSEQQPAGSSSTTTIGPVRERAELERFFTRALGSSRSSSFMSAYAMGPQGMRAIWIERNRRSTLKQIVACRLLPDPEDSLEPNARVGFPRALDALVVYAIESYDLREDITHCALGEVSGRIVLGNRVGDVFVLETGVDFKLLSSRAITAHTAFHLLLNMPITFTASSSMTFLSDIEDNNSRALSFLSSIRAPLLSFFPKSLWQESVVDLTSYYQHPPAGFPPGIRADACKGPARAHYLAEEGLQP
ncbi:hypothetical protein BT96DRAFT_1024562 [Gymnopus androsaceus JB14]|uniref:F-box domain-containing protein n=1 Tax=Gymnopus androsaceus JB14 TaxID=1447944 RepID=A0A6A4GXH2_9AGAR|nr:hypothetical protein BT96DRAFT_1024562 [Gymnopus androsaceus JB14]